MEEALHLDGVQFADESVMSVEVMTQGAPGAVVESMSYMEDQDIMMDTGDDQIVGLGMEEYEVGVGADMPALGGEEEVLTLHTTIPSSEHSHAQQYGQHYGDHVFSSSEMEHESMDLDQLVRNAVQSPVKREIAESSAVHATLSSVVAAPPVATVAYAQPAQLQLAANVAPRPVQMKATAPRLREIAIAPKPAASAEAARALTLQTGAKAWSQAPRLVPLAKGSVVKKLSVGGVVQSKPQTIIGQLGKQLVMVGGAGGVGGARLKLVSTSTASAGPATLHYIKTESGQQMVVPATKKGLTGNPMLTKMLVQDYIDQKPMPGGDKQSVLAKMVPSSGAATNRMFTIQQAEGGGGVSKSTAGAQTVLRVKPRPQHVISIKSPPRLVPVTSPGGSVSKRVVISGASAGVGQSVVLKSAAGGGQIHQINVPGKGVQYIRLVSAGGAGGAVRPLAVSRPRATISIPSKTLLLPDAVQGTMKTQQKLVRIAPVTKHNQHSLLVTSANSARGAVRSAQSLLAPLSPARGPPLPALQPRLAAVPAPPPAAPAPPAPAAAEPETEDTKDELRDLIKNMTQSRIEVPIEYESVKIVADSVAEQTLQCEEQTLDEEEEVEQEEGEERGEGEGADNDHDYHSLEVASFMQRQMPELNTDMVMQSYQTQIYENNNGVEVSLRQRKACNCTKSQCLKLYCDCFANGEFCHQCNCANCHNNLDNEELRQKAIRGCLERNPNAFRPKIGKGKSAVGPEPVRRHNKGCNCKRSGCLKNYCECYEAKIACSGICRCVGCRNVEDGGRRKEPWQEELPALTTLADYRPPPLSPHYKQPCSFMTMEVIEAVCQCLVAAGAAAGAADEGADEGAEARVPAVLEEFSRCLQDIIGAARHAQPAEDAARA